MKKWFRRPPPELQLHVHVSVTAPSISRRKLVTPSRVVVPTDMLIVAWRQLFPAERLIVFGGRTVGASVRITSAVDVTEATPSSVHVRACPERLAKALIDFDRTGAHLAMWMHSHPGEGPRATHPSHIDIDQDRSLRQHYSERLVSLIAVRDGYLRVFGAGSSASVSWLGAGVSSLTEDPNVSRLSLA